MSGVTVITKVVFNKIPTLTKAAKDDVERVLHQTADDMIEYIIEDMGESKSGRIYRKAGGGSHRASAPGESPAIDTGALAESLTVFRRSAMVWYVGSDLEYAPYLEYGTYQMAPRPYLRPAAARFRPIANQRVHDAIARRFS